MGKEWEDMAPSVREMKEIIVMRRNFHFPLRGELVVIKKKCINIVGMGKKMLLCKS